jgi:hypothetical protein
MTVVKAILFVLAIAGSAIGQSASDAAAISRMQRDAILSQNEADKWLAKWHSAIRLGFLAKQQTPHDEEQCLNIRNLQAGAVGYLDCFVFEVAAITKEKRIVLWIDSTRNENFFTRDLAIMVDKQDVTKLADADLCVLLGLIKFRGIEEWHGQKLRCFEFLTEAEVATLRQNEQAALKARQDAIAKAEEDAQYITWKSKAGTEVEAKFIKFKDNKVELLTKDGRKLSLALSVFTNESLAVIRKIINAERVKK